MLVTSIFSYIPLCFLKPPFAGSLKQGIVWEGVDNFLDWTKLKAFADGKSNCC